VIKHAFTLIELLVVITIVSVLSSLSVVVVGQASYNTRKASATALMRSMTNAIKSFQQNEESGGSVILPKGTGNRFSYYRDPQNQEHYLYQGTAGLVSDTPTLFTDIFSGQESVSGLTYGVRVDPSRTRLTEVMVSLFPRGTLYPLGTASCPAQLPNLVSVTYGVYCRQSDATNPAFALQANSRLAPSPNYEVWMTTLYIYHEQGGKYFDITQRLTTDEKMDTYLTSEGNA
jgi:prepilin-type N-terminal cleavage/methylation domain-containing protein